MNFSKIVIAVLLLVITSSPNAAVYKEGKVTSVKMFADKVVIYVDSIAGACSRETANKPRNLVLEPAFAFAV